MNELKNVAKVSNLCVSMGGLGELTPLTHKRYFKFGRDVSEGSASCIVRDLGEDE